MSDQGGVSRESLAASLAGIRGRLANLATAARSDTDVQHSLGEMEKLVSGVLESLSEGYLLLDKDLVVLSFNPAAERLLNRRAAEVVGHGLFDGFPEGRGSVFETEYKKAVALGKPAFFTYYFETPPYVGWYEVRVFPGARGVEVFFNISSERRKAEAALQGTIEGTRKLLRELGALVEVTREVLEDPLPPYEKTARSLFDRCRNYIGARAGYVALVDAHGLLFVDSGGMTCAAPSGLAMRVCDPRGHPFTGPEPKFENAFARSPMREILPAGHMPLENILLAPLLVDGRVEGVLALANKEGGFTEEDARISRSFADLAALALRRSRSWGEMRRAGEEMRALFDAIGDAVYLYDFEGRIMDVNATASLRLGRARRELLGLTLADILSPASARALPTYIESMRREGRQTYEAEYVCADGTVFPAEVTATALSHAGKPAILAVARDISHRKRAAAGGPGGL